MDKDRKGDIMPETDRKTIEVRGFMHLDKLFKQNNWPVPLVVELEQSITGAELVEMLGLSGNKIEIMFVNGLAQSLGFSIQPGDRVALLPPGCPGPYRLHLGFYAKNKI